MGLLVDAEDRRRLDEALDRLQLLQPPQAVLDRILAGEALRMAPPAVSLESTDID